MTGNYLLTIGALALLSILVLATNNLIRDNDLSITESKVIITGTSLGQALIDEIKTKAFDEAVYSGSIDSTSDLTAILGTESGEIISLPDSAVNNNFASTPTYDDVDDYNGYSRKVDTPNAENYTVSSIVEYAVISNPENTSGSKTFCKRLTVTVTSPFFSTIPSITLKYAFTY